MSIFVHNHILSFNSWPCCSVQFHCTSLPRHSFAARSQSDRFLCSAMTCIAVPLLRTESLCPAFPLQRTASPCLAFASPCTSMLCLCCASRIHALPLLCPSTNRTAPRCDAPATPCIALPLLCAAPLCLCCSSQSHSIALQHSVTHCFSSAQLGRALPRPCYAGSTRLLIHSLNSLE